MKRLCTYNGLVAVAFVLLWVLLVVVEVKIRFFWFLGYIFFGSLPFVFVSFFIASWRALRPTSEYPAGKAGLLSLVLTPVFIFVGVTLVRSEEHTSELQSLAYLVCRLLLEKKKSKGNPQTPSTAWI